MILPRPPARIVRRLTGIALGLASVMAAPAASGAREMEARPIAVLQGLDKVAARTTTIEVPVGETRRVGTLAVRVRACRESLPIDPPESAAFVEVWDMRQSEAAVGVFSGWMFASSPALSAIEHPTYDVWVLECKSAPTSAPSSTGAPPATGSPPAPGNRAVR
jgi:hypothetical protein